MKANDMGEERDIYPGDYAYAENLTRRQQQLLDYMVEHQQKTGLPPTIREMGAHLKINSPNGVMCHLRSLRRKGVVEKTGNNTSHSWRAVKRLLDVTCPHCGKPIEVQEDLK